METRRIEFLPSANQSLRALFAYISKDNAQAALALVDRIERRIMRLAESPYMGFELPREAFPTLEPGCRRLIVHPYVVFYRVMEDKIVILHIIHERRNLGRVVENPHYTDAYDDE